MGSLGEGGILGNAERPSQGVNCPISSPQGPPPPASQTHTLRGPHYTQAACRFLHPGAEVPRPGALRAQRAGSLRSDSGTPPNRLLPAGLTAAFLREERLQQPSRLGEKKPRKGRERELRHNHLPSIQDHSTPLQASARSPLRSLSPFHAPSNLPGVGHCTGSTSQVNSFR